MHGQIVHLIRSLYVGDADLIVFDKIIATLYNDGLDTTSAGASLLVTQ